MSPVKGFRAGIAVQVHQMVDAVGKKGAVGITGHTVVVRYGKVKSGTVRVGKQFFAVGAGGGDLLFHSGTSFAMRDCFFHCII